MCTVVPRRVRLETWRFAVVGAGFEEVELLDASGWIVLLDAVDYGGPQRSSCGPVSRRVRLNWCSLVVSYIAALRRDEALADLVPAGLLMAASTDFVAGVWCSAAELYERLFFAGPPRSSASPDRGCARICGALDRGNMSVRRFICPHSSQVQCAFPMPGSRIARRRWRRGSS